MSRDKMTDKEAAGFLKGRLGPTGGAGQSLENIGFQHALRHAIAALERPEPRGDLVSLEAVLLEIDKIWDSHGWTSIAEATDGIRALPRALSVGEVGARLEEWSSSYLTSCYGQNRPREWKSTIGDITGPRASAYAPTLPETITALLKEVEDV